MSEESSSLVETNKRKRIWNNPYDETDEKYKIISPLVNVIGNQIDVIDTCYNVQSIITITESDIAQNKDIVKIPDQVAGILFAAVGYRNHLIDIIGSIGQFSNGMEKFLKFFKYSSTPTQFLHYVKNPVNDLREKVTSLEAFSNKNYDDLKDNLCTYLANSGSKGLENIINEKVTQQREIKKLREELKKLHEEASEDLIKNRADIGKLVEEFKKLQLKREFNNKDLEDIVKQIKDLNEARGKYEQNIRDEQSNRMNFFSFFSKDYKRLKEDAENQIKLMKSRQKELRALEQDLVGKVERLKHNRETLEDEYNKKHGDNIKELEDNIKESIKKYEEYSNKIEEICDKGCTPSAVAAVELLTAISSLTKADTSTTSIYIVACKPIKSLLNDIDGHLETLKSLNGNKEVCDEIVKDLEESLIPFQAVVKIIQPFLTKSLQGESLNHSGKSKLQIVH
ncbi:10487_t:CDS:2 [Funneliformis mosseae]|uniref:10487_t:CDS:1 n=1 Tax=Funneliformis mosseae TaxID=27381 RepID=A0A9N9EPF7_FUNMO|nr:10487_t:CDS:2 [Funneliformis mosseae]